MSDFRDTPASWDRPTWSTDEVADLLSTTELRPPQMPFRKP